MVRGKARLVIALPCGPPTKVEQSFLNPFERRWLPRPHEDIACLAAVGVVGARQWDKVRVFCCSLVDGILTVAAIVGVVCVAQIQGDVYVPRCLLDSTLQHEFRSNDLDVAPSTD